ncbi:proteasome regulatory subunit C-terminal-domain-containing protein [Peziza echinospora]|nr:proteasome regulatory subunit C-terminal-domain-containing protein [Peziza echinospora]
MVDKGSLRSNKRSNSTSKDKDSKDSSNTKKGAAASSAKPTRSSSRRSKKAEDEGRSEAETADTGEDVEMKDETQGRIEVTPVQPTQAPKDDDGDVEMVVDDKPVAATDDKPTEDPVLTVANEIKQNFALLERGVANFDARFSLRVLRSIPSLRRRLSAEILSKVISETYPADYAPARRLLLLLSKDGSQFTPDTATTVAETPLPVLPEIDVYLGFLIQVYLLDKKSIELGAKFSTELVKKTHGLNRRTLDSLAAKVYFYYSRFHELLGNAALLEIRPQLFASLRTATLRKDIETQATIITLLLRNYLATSHFTQADLLVSKTKFPESAANNLIARYQYYLGKIRAIQLNYTAAFDELNGATRKAPQVPAAAGFIQAAHKLKIIVELLMGDIPDRALFRQPMLEKPLRPYFNLVHAVRVGELDAFFDALKAHEETFKRDGTYTLVLRLRQNVIKTGIRTMSLSYSRISLKEICIRLRLDSEESAEYIVAKAIRDGVIEATINHEKGYMQSKELMDVYATQEPQEAFHARIQACMGLHNESVKAMRFPMNQHRLELKNAQEARERERELAKEIQEGDIDEDDAGGDYDGL